MLIEMLQARDEYRASAERSGGFGDLEDELHNSLMDLDLVYDDLEDAARNEFIDHILPLIGHIATLLQLEQEGDGLAGDVARSSQRLANAVGNAVAERNRALNFFFDTLTGVVSSFGKFFRGARIGIVNQIRRGTTAFLGFFLRVLMRVLRAVARYLNLQSWALNIGTSLGIGLATGVSFDIGITLTFAPLPHP